MELHISGKNMEISEAIRQHIEKKMGKLSRHLPNIMEGKVEVSIESTKAPQFRYVVQVTLNHSGTLLRGEERASELCAAIDNVAELMDRQIERYKGRLYKKGKGVSLARGELPPAEDTMPPGRVVKVKRLAVKPMSIEEAIDQMELLGHDFFLFLEAESGQFDLIYLRQDGDYGLIQTQFP